MTDGFTKWHSQLGKRDHRDGDSRHLGTEVDATPSASRWKRPTAGRS